MFLPEGYFWLEPVIIAAAVVFVVAFIGNLLAFGSRVVNALVTAIIFAVVFGALSFYGYGSVDIEPKPDLYFLPGEYLWLEPVLIAAAAVFVVDFIGNILAFGNRFVNALVTAILFGVVFGALSYYGYGDIRMDVQAEPAINAPVNNTTTN